MIDVRCNVRCNVTMHCLRQLTLYFPRYVVTSYCRREQWHCDVETHFKNAAYDALFEKALVQTDPAVRLPMYAQLDSLAMEEHPIIPLYYDKAIRFLSNNVKGLGLNPINNLELKTVRKE